MNDRWSDLLSDYLDGSLRREDRRELEEHLETCAECTETLEALRELIAKARLLRDRPPALDSAAGGGSEAGPPSAPAVDLWPGIEARIRDLPVSTVRPLPERGRSGSWAMPSFPRLFAVAAALLLVSSLAFYKFGWDDGFRHGDLQRARALPAVQTSADAVAQGAVADINRLKESLRRRRDRIDADTYRALDESLSDIESAVADASRALAADPGNPYIQAHLNELRERQLELLRRALVLADGNE